MIRVRLQPHRSTDDGAIQNEHERMTMIGTKTRKILAVAGRGASLNQIREVLAGEPYEIMIARSAEEALQLAQDEYPDVAILGVGQPDGDGLELCRQFRDSPQTRKMSIVFLSGQDGNTDEAVQSLDHGACDYIAGPVQAEELRARIRAVVRTRSEHEQEIATTRKITRRLNMR